MRGARRAEGLRGTYHNAHGKGTRPQVLKRINSKPMLCSSPLQAGTLQFTITNRPVVRSITSGTSQPHNAGTLNGWRCPLTKLSARGGRLHAVVLTPLHYLAAHEVARRQGDAAVQGLAGHRAAAGQSSTAAREYTWPSLRNTGSSNSDSVMGQHSSLGGSGTAAADDGGCGGSVGNDVLPLCPCSQDAAPRLI